MGLTDLTDASRIATPGTNELLAFTWAWEFECCGALAVGDTCDAYLLPPGPSLTSGPIADLALVTHTLTHHWADDPTDGPMERARVRVLQLWMVHDDDVAGPPVCVAEPLDAVMGGTDWPDGDALPCGWLFRLARLG